MTKEKPNDSAKEFFPERKSLSAFRKAAADCQACDLWERALAPYIMATVHPSAILRAPDNETRHDEMRRFIDDLKQVAALLSKS